MRATFDRLGGQPPGLELSCANRIPHGRGLGSSAAAIVAGVLLARALSVGGDERLPDETAFALAAELEGHPDNIAACFFGGLTIAWTELGTARAVRTDVRAAVRPVALVPPFESSTAAARGLLPATVPHADAAFAAARSALLVAVLAGTAGTDRSCSPRPKTGCTSPTVRRALRRRRSSSAIFAPPVRQRSYPAPARPSWYWLEMRSRCSESAR